MFLCGITNTHELSPALYLLKVQNSHRVRQWVNTGFRDVVGDRLTWLKSCDGRLQHTEWVSLHIATDTSGKETQSRRASSCRRCSSNILARHMGCRGAALLTVIIHPRGSCHRNILGVLGVLHCRQPLPDKLVAICVLNTLQRTVVQPSLPFGTCTDKIFQFE